MSEAACEADSETSLLLHLAYSLGGQLAAAKATASAATSRVACLEKENSALSRRLQVAVDRVKELQKEAVSREDILVQVTHKRMLGPSAQCMSRKQISANKLLH